MATTKLPNAPSDCISRVRFFDQPGSSLLLVSSWDAQVRLYDVATGQLAGAHKHQLPVLDCTFLQGATRFLSAGLDRRLLAGDFNSRQEVQIGQHDEAIRCVEFHSQTNQVFTGSWDRTVRSWDPRQPSRPIQIVNLGTKVFALDVGTDKVIVGGADRCVHIYDARNMAEPLEKRESSLKHQIRALSVGIDQRAFASSSVEGRVAIEYFNPEENMQSRYAFKCHRVKDDNGSETVHPVNALAYHPVHGTFATGGSDGGVCVWDGYAKKRLWRLNPFDTSVSSLCFSADGKQLAVGVSYTWDNGEQGLGAGVENQLIVRQITDSEVMPKAG